MLAFAGWVIGYDGHYEFDNIGEDYAAHDVPYIGLRMLPAILGSLTPVLAFGTMRECGFPRIVSFLSAMLVAIDNGHVVQTRLILLDAQLIFFLACSMYSYVRFAKQRYKYADSSPAALIRQRVHAAVVDVDARDGRVAGIDDQLQDGRPVRVPRRGHRGLDRPVEPARRPQRPHDRPSRRSPLALTRRRSTSPSTLSRARSGSSSCRPSSTCSGSGSTSRS